MSDPHNTEPTHTNRLAHETSPYLLQHRHNPVDWYPWGAEALERARREDKPILLSIGYSACHWCHVMAHESFEDRATAAQMNEQFVNVKVDREERPDLDQIYQTALQMITRRGGGWPLTMFLTPDGRPFFGGTYFPNEERYGMPSFRRVLDSVAQYYRERRDEIAQNGAQIAAAFGQMDGGTTAGTLTPDAISRAIDVIVPHVDRVHGGVGGAPKFPQTGTFTLFLRQYAATGERPYLELVTDTLRHMAHGGIYDHLGGGFARYSTDERWLVPHFEKMLYDNALLARVYLNAFQATGETDMRDVAERTLDHILRDMRDPEGGFYSALDADSEGEEGVFYLWTPTQVRDVLKRELAALFERCYDVSEAGNFEGRNILHLPHDLEAVARSEGVEPERLRERLREAVDLLLAARNLREPPFRDEKILAGWNGMAIRALAEAGGALGREGYLEAAVSGLDFVLSKMRRDDRLLRTYKNGVSRIDAFLEDYGAVGNALMTVYEATLEPHWLDEIRWIAERLIELFWSEGEGTFYDTPSDGEVLIVRPRDVMDNATPSGNSLAVELLLRTAHLFGDERHRRIAEQVLEREGGSMARFPAAFGRLLSTLDRTVASPIEIAIIGERSDRATRELLATALAPYLPNRTMAGIAPGEVLDHSIPLLEGRQEASAGAATAYLCEGYACRAPVNAPGALAEQLRHHTGRRE